MDQREFDGKLVESAGDLDSLETSLIVKYLPLLNLSKNPLRFKFCRICEKNVSKFANRN